MRKVYLLTVILFITVFNSEAQVNGSPNIYLGPDLQIPCNQGCVDLVAEKLEVGSTNSYAVQSIPHAPPLAYNATGGNLVVTPNDDSWSDVINIPFPFCFYGDTYTQLKIGTNGAIKLGPTPLTNGGTHPWSFNSPVPSPNLIEAGNIYGVYHDLDPSRFQGIVPGLLMGSIHWFIVGTAPNRQFVVVYNNTPHFGCMNLNTSSQMVLHENSNIIDVFVDHKPRCNIWNGGRAVIGIQNNTGTDGIAPPGRNTGNYNIRDQEAWRFLPTGPSAYSTVEWLEGGNVIGTGNTINVCPSPSNTYTARTTFTTCTGQQLVLEDQVNVSFEVVNVSVSPLNSFVCSGQTTTLTAVSPEATDYVWNPGGMTGAVVDVTPTSTTTYTVTATNSANGCSAQATATVTLAQPQENVCNVLYVTPNGSPTAPGTRTQPLDLLTAMDLGSCIGTTIKMAIGDYVTDTTIITVTNFLTLEGGFDPNNNWEKVSTAGATRILRTANNVTDINGPSPRLIAIEVVGQIGFRFQDITVEVQGAQNAGIDETGVSTYGIVLNGCSDYKIVRTQIIAGNAGRGGDGSVGPVGAVGPNGADACGRNGAAGGGNGGAGGRGGSSGIISGGSGTAGDAGGGPLGGAGGSGGSGDVTCAAFGFVSGQHGGSGADGGNGANGANGANGGAPSFAAYFVPGAPGANGANGAIGSGGGGAGGSGGAGAGVTGGGGGGGGGGGAGGEGGRGGRGGGGSFALYIFDNGANSQIIDVDLFNGTAGQGGVGAIGGVGGVGGQGGESSRNPCSGCQNFNNGGGNGGQGGTGGRGGDAQAGLSALLFVDGISPEYINNSSVIAIAPGTNAPTNFGLAAQPIISMDDVACTETDMEFRALSSNAWTFDSGSSPATGNGSSATTEYFSLGRKDIGFGSNSYVGFANILLDAQLLPEFVTTAPLIDGVHTICSGEAVTFTATNGGVNYNYIWNMGGGATPDDYQGLAFQSVTVTFDNPGEYIIQLQFETNCCGVSLPSTMLLRVEETPAIVMPADAFICLGINTGVELTVGGLTTNGTIAWTPTTGLSNTTTTTVFALPTSTTTYFATLTDSSGICSAIGQVIVDVVDLDLEPVSTPATCAVLGSASVNVTLGSGDYSYLWGNGATTQTINDLQPGTYFVVVTDDVLGCQDSTEVVVDAGLETLFATVEITNESCNGASDGEIIVNAFEGTQPYTFDWTPLGVTNSGSLSDTAVGLSPRNYSVLVTDANGCEFLVEVDLEPSDSIVIIVDFAQDPTCVGINDGFIRIKVDGGEAPYDYTWTNNTPVVFENGDIVAENLAGGEYVLLVTDSRGCQDSLSVLMFVDSVPTFFVDTVGCMGSEFTIFGQTFLVDNDFIVSDTIFEPSGCALEITIVDVTAIELPEAELVAIPDTIFIDDASQLSASGGVSFNWEPISSSDTSLIVVAPQATTTYTVVVTDQFGCSSEVSVTVYVFEREVKLHIPDAFTPNGDGINDVFQIVNADAFEEIEMRVYNRWGELVHTGSGLNHGWNGTYAGREQPMELYVYYVTAKSLNTGEVFKVKGNVTLIR
jgi:gliding motility-associated-like protein